jgi:hypothetical protein
MLTLAANACAGINGNQSHKLSAKGKSLRLSGDTRPTTKTPSSTPAIRVKGIQATKAAHQCGTLT